MPSRRRAESTPWSRRRRCRGAPEPWAGTESRILDDAAQPPDVASWGTSGWANQRSAARISVR